MDQHNPPSDYEHNEPPEPRNDLEANMKSKSTWLRLFFMLVLVLLYGMAEFVMAVVVVIQFLWVLVNGEKNEGLRELGQSLATYTYEIFVYLTFNSEVRPFPFDREWPSGPPVREP
jgi:hypothetical protein